MAKICSQHVDSGQEIELALEMLIDSSLESFGSKYPDAIFIVSTTSDVLR